MPLWHLTNDTEVNVKVTSFLHIFIAFLLLSSPFLKAEKTLTIESPAGVKTITLDQDPEVVISYTPTGMKIGFSNIQMKVVCIEDPSTDGLCRLQAYDGSAGSGATIPGSPSKPAASGGDGEVSLSWTAPANNGGADIQGYRVQRALSGSTSFSDVAINTGTSTPSYVATGLDNGTAYIFRVAAINSAGTGSNSAQSDPVTPTSGASQGGAYATACSTVPSNVSCVKRFNGSLAVGGFQTNQPVPNDKVLSTPFIREAAANYVGQIDLQSFTNDAGYFVDIWLSETANGPVLNNDQSNCFVSKPYLESVINYARGSFAGASKCNIPNDTGLIWLNVKHWNPDTGDLRAYNIQLYTVAPDE